MLHCVSRLPPGALLRQGISPPLAGAHAQHGAQQGWLTQRLDPSQVLDVLDLGSAAKPHYITPLGPGDKCAACPAILPRLLSAESLWLLTARHTLHVFLTTACS